MDSGKVRPTIDELFALLKNSSLPTVLVEGKDDIIFYRRIEQDLSDIGIDMLPAGNKGSVLELRRRILNNPISTPVAFVVDNDLWVYSSPSDNFEDVITTDGYSIENDIFLDGELLNLMTSDELQDFHNELHSFIRWYALSVLRSQAGDARSYRESPHKVLDDRDFYDSALSLSEDETYPEGFFAQIHTDYGKLLRGKSLFALIVRQLSKKSRRTKFSVNQLMEVGAARQGSRYIAIREQIRCAFT